MGVNERVNLHYKQWNAFEEQRYKAWIELKTRHEAEAIGKGEITPEMQKRFDKEIADYSKNWKDKTDALNKRQAAELKSELDKEEKDKQFKRETQALNKVIETSQNEPVTPELSETERKKQEFLEAMREKTERNKDKGLER